MPLYFVRFKKGITVSKKYTAKEVNQVLRDVLCGALEHIDAIKREIGKIGKVDENSDPALVARAKVMHLTLTCINDIIHPAHKHCYKFFDDQDAYFDILVKNHAIAVEKKMVPPCYCMSCDPDQSKRKEKIKEMVKERDGKDIRPGTDNTQPDGTNQ